MKREEQALHPYESRNEHLWKCLSTNLLSVPEKNAKEFLEKKYRDKFAPPEIKSLKAM